MRNFACLLVFITSTAAFGAGTKVIEVIHRPGTREETRSQINLKQTQSGFLCRTDQVPEHGIRVRGLTLKAPFKQSQLSEPCLKAIRWDNEKTCYRPGENRILDDLFRECFNF